MMAVAADPVVEASRIMTAATEAKVRLCVLGGIGVALVCPTIRRLTPTRTYHDIDLAAPVGTPAIGRLLTDLGYEGARRFNTLNGSERLLFHDPHGRRIDVFIGTLRMCHELSLDDAFASPSWTLPPADLVLSKLQIVELTDRDAQDLLALFADFELSPSGSAGISVERIERVCGGDWGWWRTANETLRLVEARWLAERASLDVVATQVCRRSSGALVRPSGGRPDVAERAGSSPSRSMIRRARVRSKTVFGSPRSAPRSSSIRWTR
jgi:hypothetical protein